MNCAPRAVSRNDFWWAPWVHPGSCTWYLGELDRPLGPGDPTARFESSAWPGRHVRPGGFALETSRNPRPYPELIEARLSSAPIVCLARPFRGRGPCPPWGSSPAMDPCGRSFSLSASSPWTLERETAWGHPGPLRSTLKDAPFHVPGRRPLARPTSSSNPPLALVEACALVVTARTRRLICRHAVGSKCSLPLRDHEKPRSLFEWDVPSSISLAVDLPRLPSMKRGFVEEWGPPSGLGRGARQRSKRPGTPPTTLFLLALRHPAHLL